MAVENRKIYSETKKPNEESKSNSSHCATEEHSKFGTYRASVYHASLIYFIVYHVFGKYVERLVYTHTRARIEIETNTLLFCSLLKTFHAVESEYEGDAERMK